MTVVSRVSRSPLAVVALIAVAVLTAVLAMWPVSVAGTGTAAIVLLAGERWVARFRPGPVHTGLGLVGLLAAVEGLVTHDLGNVWVVLTSAVAAAAGLVNGPLGQRLVPEIRVAQLPGVRSSPRADRPGPFDDLLPLAGILLAVLLILETWGRVPMFVYAVVAAVVVLAAAVQTLRLRTAVMVRRRGTVNRAVTEALTAYAPEFFVYFSGPEQFDYQVRMWLPYLERLGMPYAVLSRTDKLLPRAASLTSAPVVSCPQLAGLDDCMVPSVRAVFYVNTQPACADGVRYLDRTHVHLNHGDSDKPSSYHPMIAMFDQVFVAGQAAIDRFARHGVVVPPEKFVPVGRPQVADTLRHNIDPLPGCRTVLYAPTWRGGVQDMSLSSLDHGEQIVQALIDHGLRVVFRPHPYSLKSRHTAAQVARIDALLEAARTPQCPHRTSAQTMAPPISEMFNLSDALVTDVSSVASDYLQSGKPLAVIDMPSATGGRPADPQEYPVLRAAYLLDPRERFDTGLEEMLVTDPLAATREELRDYYLGDHADSAISFTQAAARAVRHAP